MIVCDNTFYGFIIYNYGCDNTYDIGLVTELIATGYFQI